MATQQALHTVPLADPRTERRWQGFEALVAWGVALVIGTRFILTQQFALGYLPAIALAPVWWSLVRQLVAARLTLLLGLGALANGLLLMQLNAGGRAISRTVTLHASLELVGVLACAATMLWVFRTIGIGAGGVGFALGMLAGANPNSAFNSGDPWRLAFAMPITMLVLFGAVWFGRRRLEAGALLVLAAFAAVLGSRSVFGAELMALILFGVWSRRHLRQARLSMPGTVAALGGLAWAAYSFGRALLLEGVLGEAARVRTEYQIQVSGELILGGRPELAATIGLLRDRIWGYGVGVRPSFHDLEVGRNAMWQIGYDPLNGYVERYMFGDVFRLHSIWGELWAGFGIVGLVFVGYLAWQVIRTIQQGPRGCGDATMLLLAMLTAWNLLFAPWFASLSIIVLFLALSWTRTLEAQSKEVP